MTNSRQPYITIFALILALGLIAAAFVLGSQFKNLRQPGNITVKGLATKAVAADSVNWKVGVSAWGADYKSAMTLAQNEFSDLKAFIKTQGFDEKSYRADALDVAVKTEEYQDDRGYYRTRNNGYTASQNLIVSSKDLSKIKKALSAVQNARANNQNITFEQPEYIISNLESIKHELIGAATEDAKKRADEFAKTGGASVGAMQSASQGSFNIYAAGQASDDDAYGGTYDKTTVDKTVRLVVTIKYAID